MMEVFKEEMTKSFRETQENTNSLRKGIKVFNTWKWKQNQ